MIETQLLLALATLCQADMGGLSAIYTYTAQRRQISCVKLLIPCVKAVPPSTSRNQIDMKCVDKLLGE